MNNCPSIKLGFRPINSAMLPPAIEKMIIEIHGMLTKIKQKKGKYYHSKNSKNHIFPFKPSHDISSSSSASSKVVILASMKVTDVIKANP